MNTPARGIPYEGETPEEAARRQRVATGPLTLVQGGGAAFTPSAVRRPGRHMHPELRAQLAARAAGEDPEAAPEVLQRVILSLQSGSRQAYEQQPAARGAEPLYAEALAAHQRHAAPAPEAAAEPEAPAPARAALEGPLPAVTPAQPPADAEPLAAVTVPKGLQKYLRELADYAALGVSALMAGHGTTPERVALAGRLARLGQALTLADDDEGALRALAAEGGRQQ